MAEQINVNSHTGGFTIHPDSEPNLVAIGAELGDLAPKAASVSVAPSPGQSKVWHLVALANGNYRLVVGHQVPAWATSNPEPRVETAGTLQPPISYEWKIGFKDGDHTIQSVADGLYWSVADAAQPGSPIFLKPYSPAPNFHWKFIPV